MAIGGASALVAPSILSSCSTEGEQTSSIDTSAGGEDPIIYQTGSSNFMMEVGITTTNAYKDSNGTLKQFNVQTTFSHSVDWKP